MRILVIDNNILPDYWGSEELRRYAKAVEGATVVTRRGPHQDLPKSPAAFDRVVVSGSLASANEDAPWISDLLNFIKKTVEHGVPYLGVCFGHQMLARALGGITHVRRAPQGEFGWTKIRTVKETKLFSGLPSEFFSFSHHHDEVCELPKGTQKTAESDVCPVQGFEVIGKPVFGIQFHPEKSLEEAKRYFKEELAKPKKDQKVLFFPKDSDRLYRPEVAETLFKNFFLN